jgi:ectoine hydroxylase-related dioxygenase (phytanoyl-CoA dioxygenase family)
LGQAREVEKFIPLDRINHVLAMAKHRMGENGDRNAPPEAFTYFNPLTLRGLKDPTLGPIIDHCGRSARALMARRVDVGIRYFTDYFAVKLPTKKKLANHDGAGSSDWHQDFAASASDRSGGMVFWMPLTDMTPAKGTMAFLNGSHRYGVMGHYATYGAGNLLDSYPEVADECPSSGNLTYAAGDVTVHSNMTVHSAGSNQTDDPRWTYIVIVNPADACWTGGPADAFQTDGLTLHKQLTDDRFPVIG